MKKVLKSRIFIILLTSIIVATTTLYAANKYQASEVLYNGSTGELTNVSDALNEIYNIKTLGNATSDDIMEGKTAVVQGKLVTGSATGTSSYVRGSTSVTTSSQTKSITFPVPTGYTYCYLDHGGAVNIVRDGFYGIDYDYDYDSEAGTHTVTIVSGSQPYYSFWNGKHFASYLCAK